MSKLLEAILLLEVSTSVSCKMDIPGVLSPNKSSDIQPARNSLPRRLPFASSGGKHRKRLFRTGYFVRSRSVQVFQNANNGLVDLKIMGVPYGGMMELELSKSFAARVSSSGGLDDHTSTVWHGWKVDCGRCFSKIDKNRLPLPLSSL